MTPIFTAAAELQEVCAEQGWRFCFIGGLAVLRWGEPRLTRAIDVTILTGYETEEPVVNMLLSRFTSRMEDARKFALRNRVLLLHASNRIPIDIALGALPFEERAVGRASMWRISDEMALRTCGTEDLVVHKVFAGRERDWLDVEGIIQHQGSELDRDLIYRELLPLLELKGSMYQSDRLTALFGQVG